MEKIERQMRGASLWGLPRNFFQFFCIFFLHFSSIFIFFFIIFPIFSYIFLLLLLLLLLLLVVEKCYFCYYCYCHYRYYFSMLKTRPLINPSFGKFGATFRTLRCNIRAPAGQRTRLRKDSFIFWCKKH